MIAPASARVKILFIALMCGAKSCASIAVPDVYKACERFDSLGVKFVKVSESFA
jgi:hypothetical protein